MNLLLGDVILLESLDMGSRLGYSHHTGLRKLWKKEHRTDFILGNAFLLKGTLVN
jgi:hypothetical protein